MLFVLLLIGFLSATASAEQQWFDRHSEGWFWYQHIAEPEKDEKEVNIQNEMLKPLTTAWSRNNIGQFLDKAIDHPSKENVSNYLYPDRLVKEKAERFSRIGKQVMESDPMLDENVRRPISPAAAKIKDDIAYQAKENTLRKIAKAAGLLFYYQGNCRLCHSQARTIILMKELYGFEVIAFSTDGIPITELPDSRIERYPHPRLNILTYPALFLMQPPDKIVPLRQGGTSFTNLADRVLEVALRVDIKHHPVDTNPAVYADVPSRVGCSRLALDPQKESNAPMFDVNDFAWFIMANIKLPKR